MLEKGSNEKKVRRALVRNADHVGGSMFVPAETMFVPPRVDSSENLGWEALRGAAAARGQGYKSAE